MRLYVSNKNESVPMFQSRFMEFFSHVHPATPLVLYLPAIAYFLYQALWQRGLSIPFVLALFAFGILIWTLLEYVIHRCIFHYEPKSRWGKFLHFMLHGVHHDYPNDASRLVMPPVVSIPLAVLFYFLITLTFGRVGPAIFCGVGLRLRLLRRDPLRGTPFRHETRNLATAETVSSSSPLSRRSRWLWSPFAPLGLRFSNHTKIKVGDCSRYSLTPVKGG